MLFFIWIRVDAVMQRFYIIHVRKGPEKPVPDRKDIPIIGVGQGLYIMVMHLMHIRGDNDP